LERNDRTKLLFARFDLLLQKNDKGLHPTTSNIEVNPKPTKSSDTRKDLDYLIKINDFSVVGRNYENTLALMRNEAVTRGSIKLEIVDWKNCPENLKDCLAYF
jgi:hypothetical protein